MKIIKISLKRKITKILLWILENFRKVPRSDSSLPIYCFRKAQEKWLFIFISFMFSIF